LSGFWKKLRTMNNDNLFAWRLIVSPTYQAWNPLYVVPAAFWCGAWLGKHVILRTVAGWFFWAHLTYIVLLVWIPMAYVMHLLAKFVEGNNESMTWESSKKQVLKDHDITILEIDSKILNLDLKKKPTIVAETDKTVTITFYKLSNMANSKNNSTKSKLVNSAHRDPT